MDRARVTLFDQVGQVARMIDMGMGEDDGIKPRHIKREIQILRVRLLPAALK
jgi:hypothetical protein